MATLHNQRTRHTALALPSESTLPQLFDRRLSVLTVALRVESVSGLSLQPLARGLAGEVCGITLISLSCIRERPEKREREGVRESEWARVRTGRSCAAS